MGVDDGVIGKEFFFRDPSKKIAVLKDLTPIAQVAYLPTTLKPSELTPSPNPKPFPESTTQYTNRQSVLLQPYHSLRSVVAISFFSGK